MSLDLNFKTFKNDFFFNNIKTIDGTSCGNGKLCLKGQCVNHPQALKNVCPFGDSLVTSLLGLANLPRPSITCQEAFKILADSGVSVEGYCANQQWSGSCCLSCLSMN